MKRLLVVLALLGVFAAGCGGVEDEPNLAMAAERTRTAGTARIEVQWTEIDGEANFACTGEADQERVRLQIECRPDGPSKVEMLVADGFYARFSAANAGDVKWHKGSGWFADALTANLRDLQPDRYLSILRAAARETKRIGQEDIRGVSAIRYRLTVDCNDASLHCRDTAPVETWVDDDGLVRRISFTDDEGTGTVDFFDFGADIDIRPPPADEVVKETGTP